MKESTPGCQECGRLHRDEKPIASLFDVVASCGEFCAGWVECDQDVKPAFYSRAASLLHADSTSNWSNAHARDRDTHCLAANVVRWARDVVTEGRSGACSKEQPSDFCRPAYGIASQQVTRQVRSALWPRASLELTAVDANPGSRITAGALNNPVVYQRAAGGAMVSQLLTDFGRTTNLISSANLAAKAENQNALATKEQILLAVDQAFYNALQSHAVLAVAQQTVSARQTLSNQVGALFKSKLKSELDFSFANVNLAQAKLLLLDAENNENSADAALSACSDSRTSKIFSWSRIPPPCGAA